MKILLQEIDGNGNEPRSEREAKAVGILVRKAFGEDAEKSNLATGAPVIKIGGKTVEQPFSLSHCRTMAAMAVSENGKAVGIDVEEYREQLHRIKHKYLTAEELSFYTSDSDLLRAWTLKEAVYKAALTPGLALTDIKLPLDGTSKLISAAGKTFEITHSALIANTSVHLSAVTEKK